MITIKKFHSNQLNKSLFVIIRILYHIIYLYRDCNFVNSSIFLSNLLIIINNAMISLYLLLILFIKQLPVLLQWNTIYHLKQENNRAISKPESIHMWDNVDKTIQRIESWIDLINRRTDLYDPNFFPKDN